MDPFEFVHTASVARTCSEHSLFVELIYVNERYHSFSLIFDLRAFNQ